MKGIMKIHQLTASIAAVLLSASLFSCSSDDFFGKPESGSTNGISFGVSTENSAATRANKTDDGLTVARYTLRSDNSADTLCVRAVVTDGIGNSANKPATRAAMQTSMYNDFKVVAEIRENGNIGGQYFMNETATKSSNNWVPAHTYYWPGSNRQLRFLAWAPTDAFQAVPNTPNATTLQYTTPAEAKNQRDLVAAATDFMESPANDGTCTPVSLNFKHLCTAVIIKTGKQMTAGTIKSVSLKGVKYSGTYDMVNSKWTLNNSTAAFTISPNKETTGATHNGTDLNAGESTFMLLPQKLGADSKLEVEFDDKISGNYRKLSASLDGAEWPMGQTVTYRLSITPEYELNIDNVSEFVDAHYVIEPIKIRLSNLESNTKWTLTTKINGEVYNGTNVSVQLSNDVLSVVKEGFWIDKYVNITRDNNGNITNKVVTDQSARGTTTVTGNGNIETDAYVFIPENIGNNDRNITITLKVDGTSDADAVTKTIIQKCPSWNGSNVGYERFEENNGGNYPFGFLWDRKVKYSYEGFWAFLFKWSADSYKTSETQNYLTTTWKITSVLPPWKSLTTATIDYTKLNNSLNVGMSNDNGLENTRKLYTFKGIGTISEMETILDKVKILGYTWEKKEENGGDYQTVKNFAAKMAVMKNKFNVEKREETNNGETLIFYVPDIDEKDILWYLPASNEQMGITDTEYPLSGTYWSSTAADNNTNAYIYSSGSSIIENGRMATHKIRAVRKK